MSSDLQYSVGVDATELNTGVAAVEARLEQSGVSFAEQPKKFAKASADAFNEVYSAEDKLATLRKKSAFDRMSDEEKLTVLRHEGLGLLGEIQNSEKGTAEHANLSLQFEQKKNQIYDLNQKVTREQTTALAAQTPIHKEHEGLLGKAEEWGGKIKKSFHEMGISLHGAGIGLVLAEVVNLGKEAVQEAQKQRDEYDKLGKPLDSATRSMASLGDALTAVHHGAVAAVGFLLGGFTQLGDLIGSSINRLRGISEAQENIAAASQRAADAAQARAAKLKEEQHDVEKIAAARKDAAEAEKKAAFDRLDENGKINALLAENFKIRDMLRNTEKGTVAYYERQKLLSENLTEIHQLDLKLREEAKKKEEELAKKVGELKDARRISQDEELELFELSRKKASQLTGEEAARLEVLRLQKQERNIQVNIDQLYKKGIENLTDEEKKVLSLELEQRRETHAQIAAKEALIGTIEDEADAEEEVTEELEQQAELRSSIDRIGNSYESQSTTALEGILSRLRAQLKPIPDGYFPRNGEDIYNSAYYNNAAINPEVHAIEDELKRRREVAGYASLYGEDAARYTYGDTATDKALRDMQDDTKRNRTATEQISTDIRRIFELK